MPKLSDNQAKAVEMLKGALGEKGQYATLSSWKGYAKVQDPGGVQISPNSLNKADALEEITVIVNGKPTQVYKPKA